MILNIIQLTIEINHHTSLKNGPHSGPHPPLILFFFGELSLLLVHTDSFTMEISLDFYCLNIFISSASLSHCPQGSDFSLVRKGEDAPLVKCHWFVKPWFVVLMFGQDILRSWDVLIWTLGCWVDGVWGLYGGGYWVLIPGTGAYWFSFLAFSPRTSMFSSTSVFWILSEPRKTQKLISSIRTQLQWQSMKTSSQWACLERLMVTSPSSKANPFWS